MMKTFVIGTLILILVFSASAATSSGAASLAQGRVDEAITAMNARIAKNSNDAEAYHLLSRAYFDTQHWDEAIANGERAVALQPSNSDYHMWLGRAYGEKADASSFITAAEFAKKVRVQFEQALQLNRNNTLARCDLAEYYVGAPGFLGGGKEKARALADQVATTDPATAHWILAITAEKDKNYDVAEQEFKAAIQSSKSPARDWLHLASYYRKRSRPNDMEAAVNNALVAPNPHPTVRFDAAEILLRGGRNFSGAAQLLRTYIDSGVHTEEAPVFQAHYLLGTVLEKLKDRSGAANEYRAALTLARDYQKAQAALKRIQ